METGDLIGEEEVEVDPQNIPSAAKDPNINLNIIRKYFNADGWAQILAVHKERLKLPFYCNICLNDADKKGTRAIYCDSCCEWYHFDCVDLLKMPTSVHWFCKKCK